VTTERELSLPYSYLEQGAGFTSRLFNYARTLVRGARERQKPNGDRLREYRDTALSRIEQQLKAPAGSYWFDPELNRAVAVHPAIMLEGLRKVYKANELLAELGAK
jgi:hypothetical protein